MDIGVELLMKVTESFQKAYNEDVSIKVLEKRLQANKAHYEDAARYSERVGELLSEAYGKVVTSEALPGGVMTWEIAQEVIQKPLIENYKRAATASVDYISAENKRRGIGLKAQRPSPDFDRLDGFKRKLVDAEKFDDVAFMLDKPVVNFTRAVLDDAVEVNADFQAKAGLDVKIVRTTTGRETCDWCKRLAGTYDYEDVRHGHDVWKRHLDYDCKIVHVSEKGRKVVQNCKRSNREQIEARKQLEAPNDRAPEKIEARKQLGGINEQERADKKLRRDNPEIVVDWKTVNSVQYRSKFDAISDNDDINKNLLKASKEILRHRGGTMQEDIYLLDVDSGKVVYKQTSSNEVQAVSYPEKMKKLIKANPGKYITIHNHPKGRPPSAADINSQYVNKYCKGVVCTHDGRVFVYEVGDGFEIISRMRYELTIAKYKKEVYNETEAQIRALIELSEVYGFIFKEV